MASLFLQRSIMTNARFYFFFLRSHNFTLSFMCLLLPLPSTRPPPPPSLSTRPQPPFPSQSAPVSLVVPPSPFPPLERRGRWWRPCPSPRRQRRCLCTRRFAPGSPLTLTRAPQCVDDLIATNFRNIHNPTEGYHVSILPSIFAVETEETRNKNVSKTRKQRETQKHSALALTSCSRSTSEREREGETNRK